MKLLHVSPTYYPATNFGGPIFSTYALCNGMAALPGIELRVLTSDAAGRRLKERLEVGAFPVRYSPGYDVYFTKRRLGTAMAPGLLRYLPSMVRWADAVLLTGTYSFPTIPTLIACRVFGKPLVWSPRGALQATQEWTGVRRRHLKRTWEAACTLARPRRCVLHVTAEIERRLSCERLPEFDAVIIPNAVDFPQDLPSRQWKPGGSLRLMFISRIDPKKGLDILLRVMPTSNCPMTLDVYGDGDSAYVKSMWKLVKSLGLTDRVRFHGHVVGEAKRSAFLNADVMVLPTHSENFGMVVAESLAHGVPAIVSRGAPWAGLDARGCGRWIENSPRGWSEAIRNMYDADLEAMGQRGREWMQAEFVWSRTAERMVELFGNLMAK